MREDRQKRRQSRREYVKTARRLFRYMLMFQTSVIWFVVVSAGAAAILVAGPRILGLMTTQIFSDVMAMAAGERMGVEFSGITGIALLLLGLYALSYFCQYMQGRLMTRITNRSTYNIRKDVAAKLNRIPLSYFEEHSRGEILSHVTNDADVIAFSFNQTVTQFTNTVFVAGGTAIVMFTMNAWLALIVLAVLPVALLAAHHAVGKSQRHYSALQNHLSDMEVHLLEDYAGVRHPEFSRNAEGAQARAAAGEASGQTIEERFEELNEKICTTASRSQFISGSLAAGVSAVSVFAYIGICVLGGWLAIRGILQIGEIQAFIQYVRTFTQPVVQLSTISGSAQRMLSAARRIFRFLDLPEEEALKGENERKASSGEIEVRGMHVSREPEEAGRPFDLRIPEGSFVAVTGPRGSGKTAFVEALLGIREPAAGSVYIGGEPADALGDEEKRALFGVALQTVWLEDETVRDNIRLGHPGATDGEVEEAAKAAQAHEYILNLPDGYDTKLGEKSVSLSKGQAQLLQAARIFLHNPRIVVLDEALQSVDAAARRRVFRALRDRTDKTTVVFVSKEPADIRSADTILMMEDGRVAQIGTYMELVKKRGAFSRFFGEGPEEG